MAIELARESGAGKVRKKGRRPLFQFQSLHQIVCTVSDESKRDICVQSGATEVVVLDRDSKKWQQQLKRAMPEGADVCYEVSRGYF